MLINQLNEQASAVRVHKPSCDNVNRLLAAAVVSRQFCHILLNNPARAIQDGFAGEQFNLSADEYELIVGIRSSSLPDFAAQICQGLPQIHAPFETNLSSYAGTNSWPI